MGSYPAPLPTALIPSPRRRGPRPEPIPPGRGLHEASDDRPSLPTELGRLVRLVQDHDRLQRELDALGRQVAAARSYLAEPGGNVRLGAAHLERLRARRSGALALLRANRLEAAGLLGTAAS